MEREEIFGALIVLVIILVIALIIYNMHGSTIQDIRNIADEVFGWTKGEQKEELEKFGEQEAQGLIDRLIEIHKKGLGSPETGCTYSLRGYTLPEKFKIEITYLNTDKTLVKFDLLNKEDERLIASKTLDKDKDAYKLVSCIMTSSTSQQEGANKVDLTYSGEGLKAGEGKFYEELPKFYKYDQNHLCYILQTTNDEKGYKKKFLDSKDCETGEVVGKEIAKNFFKNFMASVKRCRQSTGSENCRCNPIDLTNLPLGAEINAVQKEKAIKFELIYNGEKTGEEEVGNTDGVSVKRNYNFGGLKSKIEYGDWKQQTFTEETGTLYIVLTKDKKLGFPLEDIVKPGYVQRTFLRADTLPSCAPSYDALDPGCKDKTKDAQRILTTIKKEGYDKIIREATPDQRERAMLAAVIATESEGNNKAVSPTGCSGLMQFCASTAKGFNVPCGKGTCYVCDKEGCNKQDNRANPGIAISGGLKLLKDKMRAIETCTGAQSQYTYREIFGLAAYNGGEGVVCAAIKATGKPDPTWQEVKGKIDVNLLKKMPVYNLPYFTQEKLKEKVNEITCYPSHVESYMIIFMDGIPDGGQVALNKDTKAQLKSS